MHFASLFLHIYYTYLRIYKIGRKGKGSKSVLIYKKEKFACLIVCLFVKGNPWNYLTYFKSDDGKMIVTFDFIFSWWLLIKCQCSLIAISKKSTSINSWMRQITWKFPLNVTENSLWLTLFSASVARRDKERRGSWLEILYFLL